MLTLLFTNLKHFLFTFTVLFLAVVAFALYHGADAHFIENPLAYKLDKEGPHIFFEDGNLAVSYVMGNQDNGFYAQKETFPLHASSIPAKTHFALENQDIEFSINPVITTPPAEYEDTHPIIALSDIESSFGSLRDFLLANKVIDNKLNWSFGNGHLVLVGDFVDRGASMTQVLWFIYKLEQEAAEKGGRVHFIIGNHEIKNMQGNYQAASEKYFYIASVLGKKQHELLGPDAFLGRWLRSKNSIEVINGHLFVHGGIHPEVASFDLSLEDINEIIRQHYDHPYFPKPGSTKEEFLVSTKTGPAWYRGYFKDDLTQPEVEAGLENFNAVSAVVGHTIQWSVKSYYEGKVFAIDVKHPKDYLSSFPPRGSEGLLIDKGRHFRLHDDGERELL